MEKDLKFIFFGGEPLAVPVLEELKACEMLPAMIVCNPDKAVGRKQTVTPTPSQSLGRGT